MVDINDIKVGDIVKMLNGAIYTVGKIYKYQRYDLESTNGVSLMSQDVEKILKIIYVYEEEIANMDEKKVNFEVGDYVKIVADNDNHIPADCCGQLGIIVGEGYYNDYWKVYLFKLKRTCCVREKYMVKTECEYEVKPKKKENHGLSSNSGRYPYPWTEAELKNSDWITKKLLSNAYYGVNPRKYDPLKEFCKRYMEHDGIAVRAALDFMYGCSDHGLPKIKKVIFNNPATIVLWADGDKTVVKCNGEDYDKEKGLAMAICKKALGKSKTHYDYYNVFKKWIKESK